MKQFGIRLYLTFCQAWSESKLFAKIRPELCYELIYGNFFFRFRVGGDEKKSLKMTIWLVIFRDFFLSFFFFFLGGGGGGGGLISESGSESKLFAKIRPELCYELIYGNFFFRFRVGGDEKKFLWKSPFDWSFSEISFFFFLFWGGGGVEYLQNKQ